MDVFLSFISLVLLSAGLGIDNGLLIEFSLKSLNLPEKKHLVWRSVALVLAPGRAASFCRSVAPGVGSGATTLAQSAVWGANRCAYMLKVTERPTSESPLTFLEPS